jgi:hypothetical protein
MKYAETIAKITLLIGTSLIFVDGLRDIGLLVILIVIAFSLCYTLKKK